jgi:hypothetical protein
MHAHCGQNKNAPGKKFNESSQQIYFRRALQRAPEHTTRLRAHWQCCRCHLLSLPNICRRGSPQKLSPVLLFLFSLSLPAMSIGAALPCLSKSVASLTLLRHATLAERLDGWPWAVACAVAVAAARSADASRWPVSPWVMVVAVVLAYVLATLGKAWSMAWRVMLTCKTVRWQLQQ